MTAWFSYFPRLPFSDQIQKTKSRTQKAPGQLGIWKLPMVNLAARLKYCPTTVHLSGKNDPAAKK
jgi:hypothetical protein